MEFIEQIQTGFCGLLITLLLLVLYIIIASAILKCVHLINVIKIWERIEEILKSLPSHTESLSSNLCSSEIQFLKRKKYPTKSMPVKQGRIQFSPLFPHVPPLFPFFYSLFTFHSLYFLFLSSAPLKDLPCF